MPRVGQPERATQNRIIKVFSEELGSTSFVPGSTIKPSNDFGPNWWNGQTRGPVLPKGHELSGIKQNQSSGGLGTTWHLPPTQSIFSGFYRPCFRSGAVFFVRHADSRPLKKSNFANEEGMTTTIRVDGYGPEWITLVVQFGDKQARIEVALQKPLVDQNPGAEIYWHQLRELKLAIEKWEQSNLELIWSPLPEPPNT